MAEQENQGQNHPAGDEADETQDKATDNQSGQGKQKPGNTSSADPEQSGEGTGAKAGEYS
ncbi:MAG TPA: hypothetical protein VF543_09315 [Pyrinomonadaceae bacterium]|jgi:hypothetical protein